MGNESGTWIMYGVDWDDPECIWGYDVVSADYRINPMDSWQKIVDHMHEIYPIATDKQIRKVLK